MTSAEVPGQDAARRIRYLEYAVPGLSFGGALVAILFWLTSAQVEVWITILGCVFASWILAYLAWIRPRKDIVALSTPIYSVVFIAIPPDLFSAVVLELLYAVSLTILLMRLKTRFGEAKAGKGDGKSLAEPLKSYVERTQNTLAGISNEAAHSASIVFVRFAESNYTEAAERSATAIRELAGTADVAALVRAFGIIREQALLLEESKPKPENFLSFSPEDAPLLAKPVPLSPEGEARYYAALDDALLLVYAAAWNRAEKDRDHLLLSQPFAQKLMV